MELISTIDTKVKSAQNYLKNNAVLLELLSDMLKKISADYETSSGMMDVISYSDYKENNDTEVSMYKTFIYFGMKNVSKMTDETEKNLQVNNGHLKKLIKLMEDQRTRVVSFSFF